MQLKSLVSVALLLSSLSWVAGAPQTAAAESSGSTSLSSTPSGGSASLSSTPSGSTSSAHPSSTSSAQPHSNGCCCCCSGGSGGSGGGDSSSHSASSTGSPSSSHSGSSPDPTGSSNPTSSSSDSASSPSPTGSSNSTSSSNSASSPSPTGSSNSTSSGGGSSGPHFVIYADKWDSNGAPDVSKVEGYNVFALSFLLSTGPADQAQAWEQLDDSKRKQIKSQYEAAGIKLVVSAFGATEVPTTSGADPTKVAETMADWVIKMGLDGIDVDYEDLDAMNKADGKAEEWLSTFTKTLRGKLPQGKYIVTHAPVAPWFNAETYKSGAYITVNKNVGDMIDWYNVQFYNQNDYDDCNSLLTQSKTKTSVFEIAKAGVDQNKIVIGKPATAADASNGYVDTKTLAQCVSQAKEKGWSAGVMVWQYPNADSSWIKTVRGDAFPVGN